MENDIIIEDIETRIIKDYARYMKTKSIFNEDMIIIPSAPQQLTHFPTIVIKEMYNNQNINSTSTNYQETADNLTYVVDIYAKNLTVGNKKYMARNVMSELKLLTCDYFLKHCFTRTSGAKSEYVDITVDRYSFIFTATRNNWNGQLR